MSSPEYIVFGAGVIGLTTALELALRLKAQAGPDNADIAPKIAVVARHFPDSRPVDVGDSKFELPGKVDTGPISSDLAGEFYCSPFAGADWDTTVSFPAENNRTGYFEAATYVIWDYLLRGEECTEGYPPRLAAIVGSLAGTVSRSGISRRQLKGEFINKEGIKGLDLFLGDAEPENADEAELSEMVWFNRIVGGVKLTRGEDGSDVCLTSEYSSFIVPPAVYLPWLVSRLEESKLVEFCRLPRPASSLAEVHSKYSHAHTLFNCTGLGSRALEEVKDTKVYPVRGDTIVVIPTSSQTAVIRERPMAYQTGLLKRGKESYVFPRGSAEQYDPSIPIEKMELDRISKDELTAQTILLGGTRIPHVWSTHRSVKQEAGILSRVSHIYPELSEIGTKREGGGESAGFKVLPISIAGGVGLRPARVGGPRVELEELRLSKACKSQPSTTTVRVVHNYGAGGGGYQMSWGMAIAAVDKALGEPDDNVEAIYEWRNSIRR